MVELELVGNTKYNGLDCRLYFAWVILYLGKGWGPEFG